MVESTDLLAQIGAIDTGHHPVQQSETGRLRLTQDLPGLMAIGALCHIETPGFQLRLKSSACQRFVISDEDSGQHIPEVRIRPHMSIPATVVMG